MIWRKEELCDVLGRARVDEQLVMPEKCLVKDYWRKESGGVTESSQDTQLEELQSR